VTGDIYITLTGSYSGSGNPDRFVNAGRLYGVGRLYSIGIFSYNSSRGG